MDEAKPRTGGGVGIRHQTHRLNANPPLAASRPVPPLNRRDGRALPATTKTTKKAAVAGAAQLVALVLLAPLAVQTLAAHGQAVAATLPCFPWFKEPGWRALAP